MRRASDCHAPAHTVALAVWARFWYHRILKTKENIKMKVSKVISVRFSLGLRVYPHVLADQTWRRPYLGDSLRCACFLLVLCKSKPHSPSWSFLIVHVMACLASYYRCPAVRIFVVASLRSVSCVLYVVLWWCVSTTLLRRHYFSLTDVCRGTLPTNICMSKSSYILAGQHLFGNPLTDIWYVK